MWFMIMEWLQRSLREVKASRESSERYSRRKHLSLQRTNVVMGISKILKSRSNIVASEDILT